MANRIFIVAFVLGFGLAVGTPAMANHETGVVTPILPIEAGQIIRQEQNRDHAFHQKGHKDQQSSKKNEKTDSVIEIKDGGVNQGDKPTAQ